MKRVLWVVCCLAGAIVVACAQAQDPAGQAKIEPKANEILKKMAAHLAGLREFTIQVDELFDDVTERGQKIQYSNRRRVAVKKPNRLAAESQGDTLNRRFYYDGKTATLFDPAKNFYAIVNVPDNLEAMMDFMHAKFGVSQPLADLLFSDPHKVMTENVDTGSYVGLHDVLGTKCHHLAFTMPQLDWQIWIDSGEPLPRKFVITYKRLPGEPQYIAYLHKWDGATKLDDTVFQFRPPTGAIKIDFAKALPRQPDKE